MLKKLAHVSGGFSIIRTSLRDIVPVCREIAKDIRTRYTIGYVPSTKARS